MLRAWDIICIHMTRHIGPLSSDAPLMNCCLAVSAYVSKNINAIWHVLQSLECLTKQIMDYESLVELSYTWNVTSCASNKHSGPQAARYKAPKELVDTISIA